MNRRKFFRNAFFTAPSIPPAFGTGVWLFLKLPRFGASASDGVMIESSTFADQEASPTV
jgi:hypothetical protein